MSEWKLSIGTAGAIGTRQLKTDAPPTTAYIMLGERCLRNCAFCAQARESTAGSKFLSRVAWQAVAEEKAIAAIGQAFLAGKIKRVCLQVVNRPDSHQVVTRALQEFKTYGGVPVVVSSHFTTVAQAAELFTLGAERLGLALDVATPELFSSIKGGSWQERWDLLCACATQFPGRMTTHLIVGLGETEKDVWKILCDCHQRQITVGLFAFTPVVGTKLAQAAPPNLGSYRRLQVAAALLKKGYEPQVVEWQKEKISGFQVPALAQVLADGQAFRTSGCPDCNRPYYNEKPGQTLYNYHRPLTAEEVRAAVQACEVEV
ncbi:MAG: hypothetical protein RR089_00470 [Acidaminococcaceae bacterium]